jgi:hypothetical protein
MDTQLASSSTQSNIEDISLEELESLMSSFNDDIIETPEVALSDADILSITSIDEEIAVETFDHIETDESELAKAIKAIETIEMADKIYEEQESTDDHVEKGAKAVAGVKLTKVAKVAKTPRVTSFTASREEILAVKAKADYFLLETSDLELDAEAQKVKHEEVLALIKGMNVKIGAKCLNFLTSINVKSGMSTFIKSGVRYIIESDQISNPDFVDYFMKQKRNGVKSYEKSTATPQSSNLLKLFTDLKMIEKDGATYKVNDDSILIAELKANPAMIEALA